MNPENRRREPRRRCSDPLWWRAEARDDYRVGWLLERSASGAAFVIRDAWPPNVTDRLDVHVWHAPDGRRQGRGFVVHRVRPVHDDLYLVAGKFVPLEGQTDDSEHAHTARPVLASVELEARPIAAPETSDIDLAQVEAPTAIWHG